jgi:uncharacterized protein YbjQ (UPF0145 family)
VTHRHLSGSSAGLLLSEGFRPVGMVVGTAVYRIGWQRYPRLFGSTFNRRIPSFPDAPVLAAYQDPDGAWAELELPTKAYNDARRDALGRMRDEARAMGAIAVVDVTYRQTPAPTLRGHSFTAVGTAVVSDRYEVDELEDVAITNLGAAELVVLRRAGYWPLGLVGGTAVVYVLAGWTNQYARSLRSIFDPSQNVELPDYTNGLYEARDLAMKRLRSEAREVGATGVLGVTMSWSHHEREVDRAGKAVDLILTVHILGTGLMQIADPPDSQLFYALAMQGAK